MNSSRRRTGALVAVALFFAACAPDAPDVHGRRINDLYQTFSAIAAVVFAVTAGLILWSILRFRRRRGDTSLPAQFHSNVKLEVAWFAIPQLIVVFLFLSSVTTMWSVREEHPDPAVTIRAQGFQWGWRFAYEDLGVVVSGDAQDHPEFLIPVDEPVAFVVESHDVIHSFYVPRLMNKQDVVPGYENRLDFTIQEPGTYEGKCAEFCGLLHGDMNFTIRAVDASEFQDWVDEQGAGLDDG